MSRQVSISDRDLSQTGKRFTFPSVTALQTYMDLILLLRGVTSARPTSVNLDDSSLTWLTLYDDDDNTPYRVPPIQCHGYWERGSDNDDLIDRWQSSAIDHLFNFAMADYAGRTETILQLEFIGTVADPIGRFLIEEGVGYSYELSTPVEDVTIANRIGQAANRNGTISSYIALGDPFEYDATLYAAAYPLAGDFQLSTTDLCDYTTAVRKVERRTRQEFSASAESGNQADPDTRRITTELIDVGTLGLGNPDGSLPVAYAYTHAQSVAGVDI